MNRVLCRPAVPVFALCFGLALTPALTKPTAAAEAGFLRLATRAGFLEGSLDGIAVDSLGALLLAERADRVAELGEPFLFAMAEHPRGWVVGTGNGGQVILVRRDGEQETLLTAEEPQIFTVRVEKDGTVFAGSSPDGKVYRVDGDGDGDGSEVFFDPEESYIWDLERSPSGDLLVATGGEGRLYAVDASGRSSLLYDTGDTHLRRVEALAGGDLLLGTAGEGLILHRAASDGQVRTLYDSVYPEVVAFAKAPDGSVYAAVLASEASQMDLSQTAQSESSEGEESTGVSVATSTTAAFAGSRPTGFSGDRSVILRISPSGLAETVWRFKEETVYSLAWRDGKLWVGTGLDGKLYSFLGEQMTLEKDVDERQVVAVSAEAETRPGPAFATTNGAALYRVTGESERRGVYTSAALDAKQVATFGTLAWRGDRPTAATVRFSARSGMSAEPDDTWSGWSAPAGGEEIRIGDVPPGRYVQWRAELASGNGASPILREVVVSYRQHNLAPRIASLTVSPPGEIRVPAAFNPGAQVFEPVSPDKGGIFTTLKAGNGNEQRSLKTLWKKGYRTLSWEASDPNGDELLYALEFQRQGVASWLPIVEEHEETHLSFDASALPDGEYRFRLRATDRPVGASDPPLVVERVSEPVINDHSSPALEVLRRRGTTVDVRLTDAWSPLRRIELSIDAGSWRAVSPVDGLVDGRSESLSLELPAGAASALLRVMDSAFNTVTFDLLEVSE